MSPPKKQKPVLLALTEQKITGLSDPRVLALLLFAGLCVLYAILIKPHRTCPANRP